MVHAWKRARVRGGELCINRPFLRNKETAITLSGILSFHRLSAKHTLIGPFVPAPLHLLSAKAKSEDPQWCTHRMEVRMDGVLQLWIQELLSPRTDCVPVAVSVEDGSRSAAICCVHFQPKRWVGMHHSGGVTKLPHSPNTKSRKEENNAKYKLLTLRNLRDRMAGAFTKKVNNSHILSL